MRYIGEESGREREGGTPYNNNNNNNYKDLTILMQRKKSKFDAKDGGITLRSVATGKRLKRRTADGIS